MHVGGNIFKTCLFAKIVDIKECTGSPCKNGGTCKDSPNHYVCDCVTGFSGVTCEAGKLVKGMHTTITIDMTCLVFISAVRCENLTLVLEVGFYCFITFLLLLCCVHRLYNGI